MQNVKSTWISIYLLCITKNETECEIYHLCRSYIKRYQIKKKIKKCRKRRNGRVMSNNQAIG
jgi:hypothetical protein